MYGAGVPESSTTWEARSSLLEEYLLHADADVVALQETSASSFESDFSFLLRAGYDCALHAKGRMRPATFWKRSRFCAYGSPAAQAATADNADGIASDGLPDPNAPSGLDAYTSLPCISHGDRTLTVPLLPLDEDGAPLASAPPLHIVNCHCKLAATLSARMWRTPKAQGCPPLPPRSERWARGAAPFAASARGLGSHPKGT